MRSARLPLVRKHELTDYRKNQARSILFLLLLTLLLLVSVLLSLRAGSYNTGNGADQGNFREIRG